MANRRGHRFHLSRRTAGVLLHPTSLPGWGGVGDLGPAARAFVDFLQAAGQTWWQMLPTQPPGPGYSPYSALSAFAGNHLLISAEDLQAAGLLTRRDVAELRSQSPRKADAPDRADFVAAGRIAQAATQRACAAFVHAGGLRSRAYAAFWARHADWLDDHALFAAIRRAERGRPWIRWSAGLRARQDRAIRRVRSEHADAIESERFAQFVYEQQWQALHAYATRHGVGLIGDIPIFVSHDSSDVWARRELFDLDRSGRARTVSGVPPDYFSDTGQLWGHPQYRWPRHRATGFAWWLSRFERMLEHFDAVRIDHFLGFYRVWLVPGRARTAKHGRWLRTPGDAILGALQARYGPLPIIAEDLGVMVPGACALRDRFELPGMRLLHFAFNNDDADRYNQPHALPRNCVVYPGTHDNETTAAWFARLRQEHERASRGRRRRGEITAYERVLRYTGTSGREIHWDLIRLAYISPANTAIVPAQDLVGLGRRARMNTPATTRGNWRWRLLPGQLTPRIAERLRCLAHAYERV